jgi:hypothetical protein
MIFIAVVTTWPAVLTTLDMLLMALVAAWAIPALACWTALFALLPVMGGGTTGTATAKPDGSIRLTGFPPTYAYMFRSAPKALGQKDLTPAKTEFSAELTKMPSLRKWFLAQMGFSREHPV